MKIYAIKKTNGKPLTSQRSWSSADWFVTLYKTLGGAEKSAAKIEGGVFTIFVNEQWNKESDFWDMEINQQLTKLGFKL